MDISSLTSLFSGFSTSSLSAGDGLQALSSNELVDLSPPASSLSLFESDDTPAAPVALNAPTPAAAPPLTSLLSPSALTAYQRLSPADQATLGQVYQATGQTSPASMNVLLTKTDVDGRPLLLNKDANDQTLLSNLGALANPPEGGNEVDPDTRRSVLNSVINETAFPGNIQQGNVNTCSVTSLTDMVDTVAPSEYARLVTGLTNTGGVELADHSTMYAVAGTLTPDGSNRTLPDELLQSALMQQAQPDKFYVPQPDEQMGSDYFLSPDGSRSVGTPYDGLATLATSVYGRGFEYVQQPDDAGNSLYGQLSSTQNGSDTLVSLKSTADVDTPSNLNHTVVYEKSEDGEVYFRDPNRMQASNGSDVGGAELVTGPDGQQIPGGAGYMTEEVVDHTRGIYRMPEVEFANRLQGYVRPLPQAQDQIAAAVAVANVNR